MCILVCGQSYMSKNHLKSTNDGGICPKLNIIELAFAVNPASVHVADIIALTKVELHFSFFFCITFLH